MSGAPPYRDLSSTEFEEIVELVSEGVANRPRPRGAHVHRDRVNGRLRAREAPASQPDLGRSDPRSRRLPSRCRAGGDSRGTVNEDGRSSRCGRRVPLRTHPGGSPGRPGVVRVVTRRQAPPTCRSGWARRRGGQTSSRTRSRAGVVPRPDGGR